MKKIIAGLALALLLAAPFRANAAGLIPCGGTGQPACTLCDGFRLVNNILTFFLFPSADINHNLPVVPLLAGAFILVGGFFLFLGGADLKMQQRGKTVLLSVVIGLVIVYTSWILISAVLSFMGVSEWAGLGSWWQIRCQ